MARKRTDTGNSIPFSIEDFKYRTDEFLTSGHDDKGQSVRLFFRCPPTLERSLEVILHSRRFPYATITDIIRHAVIRHADWLHRMEPDIPKHFVAGLNAVNELIRDAEMVTSIQQTFVRLDALIDTYLAHGDHDEALRLISQARGQMSKVPDSRWKREFTQRFTRKYASLSPVPSLAPSPAYSNVAQFPTGGENDDDETLPGSETTELEPEVDADFE